MKNSILTLGFIFSCMVPALLPAQNQSREQFQVLVYTSPDQWHNVTEPTAITELRKMAEQNAFGIKVTQVNTDFNDVYLAGFDVLVFLHSTTRDLNDDQLECFKKFIRNGGGFVGIHAASACKNEGLWYRELIGRTFTDHPEEQTGVMEVIDKNHPATMHLPDRWVWTDEWYSFTEPLTGGLNVLLTVDESTYDPDRTWGDANRHTGMGEFHPVAWYQEYDGGRSFYTALGHLSQSYKDPWFLKHIYGGIFWAATGLGISR